MSGHGYASWNWTLINVNVSINKKANNWRKKFFCKWITKVNEEKDIWVVIDSSLKSELHGAEKIKRQIEWLG